MGLRDTIETFAGQGLPNTKVGNNELYGRHVKFNGALHLWGDKKLMGYRMYDPGHGSTAIAISEIGDNWQPTGQHTAVKLPRPKGKERHEDQRFFEHKGRLWMSCSEIYEAGNGWQCSQRLYRLDDNLQQDFSLDIHLGRNFKGTEKNWTFISYKDRLFVIYDIQNQHVCEVNDQTGAIIKEWKGLHYHWPLGHMRGGSTPLRVSIEGGKDGWLCFLHSATAHAWALRRYSMSAAILALEPPFYPTWLSKDPLCYGSREEEYCGSGNGQCVFPCGAILGQDQWHVSAGVNDTFNTIFHLDPVKVIEGLVPADYFLTSRKKHYLSRKPRMVNFIAAPEWPWQQIYSGAHGSIGLLATDDPFAQKELDSDKDVATIPASEFNELLPKPRQYDHKPSREQIKKHYEIPVNVRKKGAVYVQRGTKAPMMQPVKADGRIIYER